MWEGLFIQNRSSSSIFANWTARTLRPKRIENQGPNSNSYCYIVALILMKEFEISEGLCYGCKRATCWAFENLLVFLKQGPHLSGFRPDTFLSRTRSSKSFRMSLSILSSLSSSVPSPSTPSSQARQPPTENNSSETFPSIFTYSTTILHNPSSPHKSNECSFGP